MSLKRSGALFWFLAALLAIHKISSHTSLVKAYVAAERRNATSSTTNLKRVWQTIIWRNATTRRPVDNTHRFDRKWRSSVSIHSKNTSMTPFFNRVTTLAPPNKTPSSNITIHVDSKLEQNTQRRMDAIIPSSSENHPRSVVWPLRLRPTALKRFRAPTPTTPAPQVLLKLLQPKPTRPAIYSLDGFVPKPSIKIISTDPPYQINRNDLLQLPSVTKSRKVNRFSKNDEDDQEEEEYIERSQNKKKKKPVVSHYTAFARKGVPGQDFPVFSFIPSTEFQCSAQFGPGFYADPFTDCQVWHMCPGGNFAPRHSFLCPNGTIFNQMKRICDWWYNVDCNKIKSRNTSSLAE